MVCITGNPLQRWQMEINLIPLYCQADTTHPLHVLK